MREQRFTDECVHIRRGSNQPGRSSLVMATMVVLIGSLPVFAQSLNGEVERLLNDQCFELLSTGGTIDDLGRDLQDICSAPLGAPASGGGGSAAVQSSTASVQNRVLQRRLSRAKEPQGVDRADAGSGSGSESSWSNARVARSTEYSFFASGASGASDAAGGSGEGEPRSKRFDLFVSLAYQSLDRDLTEFENGYSSSIGGATVGFDYRFSSRFFGGILATFSRQSGDFDPAGIFATAGDFDIDTLAPSLFATILPSKRSYVQLVLGHSTQDLDVKRAAIFAIFEPGGNVTPFTGTPTSSGDGTVNRAGAQLGYDFSSGAFTFGPRLAANYSRATIDSYTETNGGGLELRVGEYDVKSVQGTLGFFAGVAISSKSGVFLPQFNIEYVREFEDVPVFIDAQFAQDNRGANANTFQYQTNVPDSDFFNADLGFSAVLPGGIQPYLSLRAMFGNDLFDSYAVNAGVRFEL